LHGENKRKKQLVGPNGAAVGPWEQAGLCGLAARPSGNGTETTEMILYLYFDEQRKSPSIPSYHWS
jgi:hypothetical protein